MSICDRGLLPISRIPAFVQWAVTTLGWRRTPERDRIRAGNPYEQDALRDKAGKLHIIYAKNHVRAGGRPALHASVPPTLVAHVHRFLRETACAPPPTSSEPSTSPSPAPH